MLSTSSHVIPLVSSWYGNTSGDDGTERIDETREDPISVF